MKKFIIALSFLLVIPAVWTQEATVTYRVEVCYSEPIEKTYKERWKRFVSENLPLAYKMEEKYGIDPLFILAQSALETGYGRFSPGNMFFGIKDHDGFNGNEQLLKTVEYFNSPNKKFKRAIILNIDSIAPNLYKYHIRDYFRKFKTPEESFEHHAKYLTKKLSNNSNCDAFDLADRMTQIKYATAPDYSSKLKRTIDRIKTFIEEEELIRGFEKPQLKTQII